MGKTITLSDELYKKLEQEAKARGLSIEALIEQLGANLISQMPQQHALIIAALRAGGLQPLSLSAFNDLVNPNVDYEAVRRELANKHFTPGLSDTIISDRG